MSIRNRTKDVGLALLKLDKLPLKVRRKSSVGGSRYSSPKDANCEKCKHIIEKSFSSEREHLMRVAAIDKDERNDKLETIVEHPLVEPQPRIEGLDVPPKLFGTERFKEPLDRRQKSFDVKLKALDDLACELMNVPPSQIDSKLLDTCARAVDTHRTYPIVENLDCDVPGYFKKTVDKFDTKEDKDNLYIDKYTNLTPLSYRSYDLHLESDLGEKSFKAEKSYPLHLDAVFKMTVEKKLEQDLDLNMQPIIEEFVPYNMLIPPPLPANETSISSQTAYEEGVPDIYRRDRTMPSYMREKRMSNRNTPELTTLQDSTQENYSNYLSALSGSTSIHETLGQRKIRSDRSSKQEIPLSQLLKQVRQRNKIMQDIEKKKLKFNISPVLSKSTCLPPLDLRPRSNTCSPKDCPPLDLRPRSNTCSPKACPPRKKEEPPKKVMPCPPPKQSPCPPPKKDPCPVNDNPCDPCKPPPDCPAPKNPCNMYTGNKFKDTITLVLCGFNPSHVLRHAFGLPLLWNCSYNLVQDTNRTMTTTCVANSQALRMKYSNESSNDATEDQPKIQFLEVPKSEQKTRDIEEVYFARSYEPWSPIPSWPMATKTEKKKLVCPKEGCKLPKVSPSKPCKEFPCSYNAADRKR